MLSLQNVQKKKTVKIINVILTETYVRTNNVKLGILISKKMVNVLKIN